MQTEATMAGAAAPERVPGGLHLNALKHGLRSDAILLPGDDVGEFHALRLNLYETYTPRTEEEARCVERIAGYQWRMARCARVEAIFDARLDTVVYDSDGGAAQQGNPDPHHWQHRADDADRREGRLERRMNSTERRLLSLQMLRRNKLLPGAVQIQRDWREMFAEQEREQAHTWRATPAVAPAAAEPQADTPLQTALHTPTQAPASIAAARTKQGAAPSSDCGNRFCDEGNGRVALAPHATPDVRADFAAEGEWSGYPVGTGIPALAFNSGAPLYTHVSSGLPLANPCFPR
jgi:hypothetical protein